MHHNDVDNDSDEENEEQSAAQNNQVNDDSDEEEDEESYDVEDDTNESDDSNTILEPKATDSKNISKSDSNKGKKKVEKKSQSLTMKNMKKIGKNDKTKSGRVLSDVKALSEINDYRETTANLIQKSPFIRLVKEISDEFSEKQFDSNYKWQPEALNLIQEASESFLVELFENMNVCASHAKRITIKPTDMQAALKINDSYKNLKTSSSSSPLANDK